MAEINLSPYTAESAAIDRRRKMAEVLQAQSMQPLDSNQMAGGWVVPVSPYAGLAKMLQGYNAGATNRQADQDMKDLYTQQQNDQKGDMSAMVKALSGQAAQPERAPMMDPQESEQMADQGTPMAPNIPAVAARAPGVIDPSVMDSMKTPQGQQMAMAQILAQLAPKDGIVLPEGASLVSKTGTVLRQGTPKQEFGTTPHYENVDGRMMAVVYDKQGNRKVIGPATPVNQFTTGTVDAGNKLQQAQFEFNNLSAAERARLENEGRRIGISGAELYFNTGMGAQGGGARLPPNAPMPQLGQNPGMAPQAPQMAPQLPAQAMPPQAPAMPRQPIPQAPGANKTVYSAPQAPQQPAPARPAAAQGAAVPPGVTPKVLAEAAGDKFKQQTAAQQVLNQLKFDPKSGLDDVSKMIKESTSGALQNAASGAIGFFGSATSGKEAIGKLTAFANQLTMDLMGGKLGSGISNADRDFIVGQLGGIADPNIPANQRYAAWQDVVSRLKLRATGGAGRGADGGWSDL